MVEVICLNLDQFNIIGMYISPKVCMHDLNSYLNRLLPQFECSCTVILGDFNVDLLTKSPSGLTALDSYKQYITTPTTNYFSLLDHIYTNIDSTNIECGVFDSYFSDHKPVWAEIRSHTEPESYN